MEVNWLSIFADHLTVFLENKNSYDKLLELASILVKKSYKKTAPEVEYSEKMFESLMRIEPATLTLVGRRVTG